MQMMHSGVRSIGEVLATLKQEFPDITISKIRFLESQGLVTPKRTASGYRQFTEDDLARLRYILRQQKENFLPLKVIKGRLNEAPQVAQEAEVKPAVHRTSVVAPLVEGGTLSRNELIKESGLSEHQVRELEELGFLQGTRSTAGTWYGDDARNIAKIAARFLAFGVEPRHLRGFKMAADREADLYKQLVPRVNGQRNTQARMEANARLEELSMLGATLRDELLRGALNS